MRDLAPELAVFGIDIAGVQFGKISCQSGESHEIRLGDRPARTAECQAHI